MGRGQKVNLVKTFPNEEMLHYFGTFEKRKLNLFLIWKDILHNSNDVFLVSVSASGFLVFYL